MNLTSLKRFRSFFFSSVIAICDLHVCHAATFQDLGVADNAFVQVFGQDGVFAQGISADGLTVAGTIGQFGNGYSYAFRWTKLGGLDTSSFPHDSPDNQTADAVSADGSVIVGFDISGGTVASCGYR